LEQSTLQGKPQDSLISLYLKGKGNRTAWREVMAAILADGSPTNMNKFGELWKNETRERKVKASEVAQEINLDEGNFGDYDAVDDEDEALSQQEQDQEVEEAIVDEHSEDWGGPESIALRQRFLQLVSLKLMITTSANLLSLSGMSKSSLTLSQIKKPSSISSRNVFVHYHYRSSHSSSPPRFLELTNNAAS
jgi:hypothetical protein